MVQHNTVYPEMCLNVVHTQRVYSQGVIQKALRAIVFGSVSRRVASLPIAKVARGSGMKCNPT